MVYFTCTVLWEEIAGFFVFLIKKSLGNSSSKRYSHTQYQKKKKDKNKVPNEKFNLLID